MRNWIGIELRRLWVRLALAFLLVTWGAIGAVALVVRQATDASFRSYLNQQEVSRFDEAALARLVDYYAAQGNWTGADGLLLPGAAAAGRGGENGQGAGIGARRGGAQTLLADADGVVVAATDPARIGTRLDDALRARAAALTLDGQTVGLLVVDTPGAQALGSAEVTFLAQTSTWLAVAAVVAGALALLTGIALAWVLTRPLDRLTEAVHDLGSGDLGRQVPVSGALETAELAHAFNRLSHDLAAAEQLRQRMAADIAHELRTPVTVLRGHLEAMLDGVYPLDAAHLAVAYDQTLHLHRLVGDLRLLTQAEAGRLPLERKLAAPETLLAQAASLFQPLALDAEVRLESEVAPGLPPVWVDGDRFQQVVANLLSNALRHTPPGGAIRLTARPDSSGVRFGVSNTGPGLTPEEAAHVFERFWRADAARQHDSGGSGLGLAITHQLVRLHGGRIWVEPGAEQTAFVFTLPAAPEGNVEF